MCVLYYVHTYYSRFSCCFIPGKVIDEIFDVLRKIQNDKALPRAYEVLQELRDISSMAMEYFDEHIAPTLKANNNKSPSVYLHGLAGKSVVQTRAGLSLLISMCSRNCILSISMRNPQRSPCHSKHNPGQVCPRREEVQVDREEKQTETVGRQERVVTIQTGDSDLNA